MINRTKDTDPNSWGFGSQGAITRLENALMRNIAMRDRTPLVGRTRSNNIGLYGVGNAVVSLSPDALKAIEAGILNDLPSPDTHIERG